MAADLVSRRPNVIVAPNNASALTAKMATTAIPIVFSVSVDPVASGLVSSLSRPGGNRTGVTTLRRTPELGPKRIELARELVPPAASIALLVNPNNQLPKRTSDKRQTLREPVGCSSLFCVLAAKKNSMRPLRHPTASGIG
jgi:ABC-type uncharacterized transport system substrate-binding protein